MFVRPVVTACRRRQHVQIHARVWDTNVGKCVVKAVALVRVAKRVVPLGNANVSLLARGAFVEMQMAAVTFVHRVL